MGKKEISCFTVGGSNGHPSFPSGVIQRALGHEIFINMDNHSLSVPTPDGRKIAKVGDTIVAYDDGTFDVRWN